MFGLVSLPRVTSIPTGMSSLDADLAIAAAARLGYSGMTNDIASKAATRDLYERLLTIGVAPISEAAVERYKRVKLATVWGKTIVAQLLIVAAAIGGISWSVHIQSDWGLLPFFVSIFGGGGLSAWLWAGLQPFEWEWVRRPLPHYARPIPAHVIASALQVRNNLEDCAFYIDDFRKREIVADPFLVVSKGGAIAYIAVWDEPTFDERESRRS